MVLQELKIGLVMTQFYSIHTAFTLASSRYSTIPQVGGHYSLTDVYSNWGGLLLASYFSILNGESTPNFICLIFYFNFLLSAVLSDSLITFTVSLRVFTAATM